MGFRSRAAVVAKYVKTVGANSQLGVWIGIGTPELAPVSAEHNTIVLWDELNPGLYGAIYSNGGQVYGAYYDGAGAQLKTAWHWGSGGLTVDQALEVKGATILDGPTTLPRPGWNGIDGFYENGWHDQGSFQVGRYSKNAEGVVRLSGVVANTGQNTQPIFHLPAGYHPPASLIFITVVNGGWCRFHVNTDGSVVPQAYAAGADAGFFPMEATFQTN